MDPEAVNAVAAELMPPDKYAWTVRPLSAHASRPDNALDVRHRGGDRAAR